MQIDDRTIRDFLATDFIEAMIRLGLIAFLVGTVAMVFAPFMGLMLWALVLAVSLYPLQQRIAGACGGRQTPASVLLVVAGLAIVGVPTIVLGVSFAEYLHGLYEGFSSNSIVIPQPSAAVADWPVVGDRVYAAWQSAATDLSAFLKHVAPHLEGLGKRALAVAAGTMGSVLSFLAALVVAGIMMAGAHSGTAAVERIFIRLIGPAKGPHLQRLSTAIIRSVATGVIGVAFIQALLLGIGFVGAGIPAAGVLAVVVLALGILQLPAAVVSLPAIGFLWWSGDASMTGNIVWTVYLMVAGMADNVLKPMLLGRGVEAPMPVILLGALGGMVSAGIVGLFLGAVLLATAYEIFMDWVDRPEANGSVPAAAKG